ncbi:MAG: DUF2851 family protein, partial [Gramella sp.]|nr:DUF2851 family protein [Christiangramia sp.]
MKEDFLYHVWKFQKFNTDDIRTSEGDLIQVNHPGVQNDLAGPDFFNARVLIGEQLWAGNVEMHLKSSDWYFHRHETDTNYDNVILHVVWNHDAEVYRKDNSVIPTLILSTIVEENILKAYQKLILQEHLKLNCEQDFKYFSDFKIQHWLERLYLERLEAKSKLILNLLERTGNNWEAVLFIMLFRSFGLNINCDAFMACAQSLDFRVVQKITGHFSLEALFLGYSGLIKSEDQYALELKKEYVFLKHKFNLKNEYLEAPQFFRLRPDNFPTIRLAQLAALYAEKKSIFQELMQAKNVDELKSSFNVSISEYWKTHYNFGNTHSYRDKGLTPGFIELLLINCVIPIKNCYLNYVGQQSDQSILDLISTLNVESNTIVKLFNDLRPDTANSAMDSQALLQLKKNYCNLNRCLECELGASLLRKSP